MDTKKYLDYEGLQFLWSKISMEDYPNNETLIAILNAIDETKADKDKIPTKVSQLENDSKFATEKQVEDLCQEILDLSQSDWNVTDENSAAYIKNKPEEATEDEIIDLMFSLDIFPVVLDEEGNILIDENNNILF